jgi:hypothetical protein
MYSVSIMKDISVKSWITINVIFKRAHILVGQLTELLVNIKHHISMKVRGH